AETQSTTEIPRRARGPCKPCERLAEAALAQGRCGFVKLRRDRSGVGTVAAEPARPEYFGVHERAPVNFRFRDKRLWCRWKLDRPAPPALWPDAEYVCCRCGCR